MKDTAFKKQNPIKRITQTQPTRITTSNKFEESEEMENKTPQTSSMQNKKNPTSLKIKTTQTIK